MRLTKLLQAIHSAFRLGVIQAPAVTFNGGIPDPGTLQLGLNAIIANGQSAAGGVNFATSAAAAVTLTGLGNLLQNLTNGGATVVTVDSAYNIGLNLPAVGANGSGLSVGQRFYFQINALSTTTVSTPTLSDTAVTLTGVTIIFGGSARYYQGTITQVTSTSGIQVTAGTTFTSLTQVGTTNNFTVALGTNAIVPTVGQLIFLTGITGTLPAGWYPINKVTSATSFVIATPPGTVWTATAATVGTSTAAPATYSPLMTIAGLYATATAVVIA